MYSASGMPSLLIQNGKIVTEDGVQTSDLLVEDGQLKRVATGLPDTADETFNASGLLIFPGFIDCHVHFREPGDTEAENMASGAASALHGGITTVCDMPNTSPPTCSVKALDDKLKRSEEVRNKERGIDIRFFFNVSSEKHLKELEHVDPKKICGVKLYFDHSTGDLGADKKAIEGAFRQCAQREIPIVCHCEDPEVNAEAKKRVTLSLSKDDSLDISAHSALRPPESEMEAVDEAIALARKHGTHLHIAHLSTKFGLDLVAQAKADKLNVTCEVAPHHLFLTVEDYKTLGALAKINPPLRTKDHADALWQGIIDGTVDCFATDHAPHTLKAKGLCHPSAELRVTQLLNAPSGVPGVETMVPLLLSCMNGGPKDASGKPRKPSNLPVRQAGLQTLKPSDLLRLCFMNPNRIFRLGKPGITIGKPADLTLVNPSQTWTIRAKELHSKCGWTPYEEWEVRGKVIRAIV
jgi:dihydroorotase